MKMMEKQKTSRRAIHRKVLLKF